MLAMPFRDIAFRRGSFQNGVLFLQTTALT
jgi:hypothetical protein